MIAKFLVALALVAVVVAGGHKENYHKEDKYPHKENNYNNGGSMPSNESYDEFWCYKEPGYDFGKEDENQSKNCSPNGKMTCNASGGFDTCDNGKEVSRACAPGTVCRPFNGSILCDWPSGSPNVAGSSSGASNGNMDTSNH